MPIYEYKCKNGHVEDLIRPIKDMDKPAKCSECGSRLKRTKFYKVNFELKGSGFHSNDYPK